MSEAERMKKLRKEVLGLTLDKFSKGIGVSRSAISEIENGRNTLSNQMVMLIRKVYGVSEMWLRTGDGDMFVHDNDEEKIANITDVLINEAPGSDLLALVDLLTQIQPEDVHKLRLIAEILTNKKG